ncbi:peroxiredoxin [Aestuariivivens sediminicola]|uniref:peroxiredoxin n=1 Tax=Aestuariivivens sediminicola TaxID=2913560 RepID=UPI001F569D56|nr:peroxiredoxin [Aestuariivivens sediminicola]
MEIALGTKAPNFKARTTLGEIDFHRWLDGNWGLLFSHPEDYTPVCTTELGLVAKLKSEFQERNIKAIALSVDSLDSHFGWIKDIELSMNTKVEFPIIADENKEVAKLYNMIHEHVSDNSTVRSVFIIGPDKRIRLILTYPMAVGRNFDEIIRVIDALQLTEKHSVVTPANWKQDEEVIISPHLMGDELEAQFPNGYKEVTNYLRYTPKPN